MKMPLPPLPVTLLRVTTARALCESPTYRPASPGLPFTTLWSKRVRVLVLLNAPYSPLPLRRLWSALKRFAPNVKMPLSAKPVILKPVTRSRDVGLRTVGLSGFDRSTRPTTQTPDGDGLGGWLQTVFPGPADGLRTACWPLRVIRSLSWICRYS